MKIELEYPKNDLFKEVYVFWLNAGHGSTAEILLDKYTLQKRETKRHKWTIEKVYSRISSENRRFHPDDILAYVSVTEEIKKDAIDKLMASIIFSHN